VAPRPQHARAALRRPAAARRRRPRRGRRPAHPPRRRADRKPRLEERPVGDEAALRAPPRRVHAHHGDARSRLRPARHPDGDALRRPHRRRGPEPRPRGLIGGPLRAGAGRRIRSDRMISLRNVEKSFKQGAGQVFVLRRIDLDVARGDFVTIMGPSGAGKSTLLAILGMLDAGWTGEYELTGERVEKMSLKQRAELAKRTVGFVFQQYHLLDGLTVAENLEVPLSYRDMKHSERQAMVADALDRFNIVGKKDLYPNQLSGGQQQLVAIARAVIARPQLLLADEPTGNLHSAQGEEIMKLFKALNEQGTTIIQVTHSDKNAEYGNRIVRLRDGWIER